MEKMAIDKQAATRSAFYDCIGQAIKEKGYTTESSVGGMLVHLGDGYFVEINVKVRNAEKFDLSKEREKYAEKTEKAAIRARKAAEKAKAQEEKAIAKAAAAAEKTI